MNKNSVDNLLKTGSAKQRSLLLANHLADKNTGGKGLLTEHEFTAIMNSFKTNQEIQVYNRYRRMYDSLQGYSSYLSQFRLSYMEVLGRLEKFILLRKSNADIEELINAMLLLIKDKKTKEAALKLAEGYSNPSLWRVIKKDKDGFVKVSSNDENKKALIDEAITNAQEQAQREQVTLKTAITVYKDYVKEHSFNITVFSTFVKGVENWARGKKGKEFTFLLYARANSCDAKIKKLYDSQFLEADFDSIEVDQVQYQTFRREYFDA